jgi:hypothetical protein
MAAFFSVVLHGFELGLGFWIAKCILDLIGMVLSGKKS